MVHSTHPHIIDVLGASVGFAALIVACYLEWFVRRYDYPVEAILGLVAIGVVFIGINLEPIAPPRWAAAARVLAYMIGLGVVMTLGHHIYQHHGVEGPVGAAMTVVENIDDETNIDIGPEDTE